VLISRSAENDSQTDVLAGVSWRNSRMLGTAQAGPITYDWVTPSFNSNFGDKVTHFAGTITVDSTGISSTPIDLTSSMIQSWQISVFDSTNTLLFSLSSAANFLKISTHSISGTFEEVPPEITTTSIFLPALSGFGGAVDEYITSFTILNSTQSNRPTVGWLGQNSSVVSNTEVNVFSSTTGTQFLTSPNIEIEVAQTPEPSTLVISSILFGVVWSYKRLKRTTRK